MGMAASQARLLSLTARLHDVELKAQNIMAQKISLSTQKDALYEKYNDALDATTIQVAFFGADAKTVYQDANYNSVCTFNKDRVKQYALRDNQSGLLLVTPDVKDAYESFGNDKYIFAYAMLGFDNSYGWGTNQDQGFEIGIGTANDNYGYGSNLYMTECEQMAYDEYCNEYPELKEKFDAIQNAETTTDKSKALSDFRDCLYKKCSSGIFKYMNLEKNDKKEYAEAYDERTWADVSNEFNYYVNLWTAINEAGGCTTIDSEYTSGDTGTDWFNSMVNAGLVTIMVWDENNSINKAWTDTSVATSTNKNYLQEVQDDKDLKKAEAEYEHELDIINRKDTKFDNELNKLETERTAITTEIESIGKVRDDNIDRTFGIFS